ncbi:hypothetical protein VNO78_19714 [Psophocarpus tetragonolobus]|uniref:Uncharacterized protein n=1 Tax=Psophocarpus tetragonolobus TaxID=3891 RepID=A0AAN9XGH2_PSOTE
MPMGECIITLQDVTLLLGQRIDEILVIGTVKCKDWEDEGKALLGKQFDHTKLRGNNLTANIDVHTTDRTPEEYVIQTWAFLLRPYKEHLGRLSLELMASSQLWRMAQPILQKPLQDDRVYDLTLRCKDGTNWIVKHAALLLHGMIDVNTCIKWT